MKKHLLFPILLFAMPSPAIADNLPVNYMIIRGQVLNLDHLWGKGVVPVITAQPTAQPTAQTESREVRDNRQRVSFENARNSVALQYLLNAR